MPLKTIKINDQDSIIAHVQLRRSKLLKLTSLTFCENHCNRSARAPLGLIVASTSCIGYPNFVFNDIPLTAMSIVSFDLTKGMFGKKGVFGRVKITFT